MKNIKNNDTTTATTTTATATVRVTVRVIVRVRPEAWGLYDEDEGGNQENGNDESDGVDNNKHEQKGCQPVDSC